MRLRRVNKQWFEWFSVSEFTLNNVSPEKIALVADCFSRCNKPISLNFLRHQPLQSNTELMKLTAISQLISLSIATDFNVSTLTQLQQLTVTSIDVNTLANLSNLTRLATSHIDNTAGPLHLPNQLVELSFDTIQNITSVTNSLSQLTYILVRSEDFDSQFFANTPNIKVLNCRKLKPSNKNPVYLPKLEKLVTQDYFGCELFQLENTLTALRGPNISTNGLFLRGQMKMKFLEAQVVPVSWVSQPEDSMTVLEHLRIPKQIRLAWLQRISTYAHQLTTFDVVTGSNITSESLDCLTNLQKLENLCLTPYESLTLKTEVLSKLSRLTQIEIKCHRPIGLDSDFSQLVQLQSLRFNDVRGLTNLEFLTNFSNLTLLRAPSNLSVPPLPNLEYLVAKRVENLSAFSRLNYLAISSPVTIWDEIAAMTKLRTLKFHGEFRPEIHLTKLTNLRRLKVFQNMAPPTTDYCSSLRALIRKT